MIRALYHNLIAFCGVSERSLIFPDHELIHSGIVSRNRDVLPREVGWFNEYGGNKLVCALSDNDEEEENVWVLTTAYRWARLRMTSDSDRALEIDPDVITKGINEIEASLRRMQTVTTKCKSISKATGEIEELIKEEKGKIKDEIGSILHSLRRQGQ